MPFVLDLIGGGSGTFPEVDDTFTRLDDALQLKFDEIAAKFLQMESTAKDRGTEEITNVTDGLNSVKEKVAAIESMIQAIRDQVDGQKNRVKVFEKATAAEHEDGPPRKESAGGKLDTRDIASWAGPNDKEFVEFAWSFYINCNGALSGLGTWAEWAARKDTLKTPVPDRTDPEPNAMISLTRASEKLFYTLNQKIEKVPKAMAILRMLDGSCWLLFSP